MVVGQLLCFWQSLFWGAMASFRDGRLWGFHSISKFKNFIIPFAAHQTLPRWLWILKGLQDHNLHRIGQVGQDLSWVLEENSIYGDIGRTNIYDDVYIYIIWYIDMAWNQAFLWQVDKSSMFWFFTVTKHLLKSRRSPLDHFCGCQHPIPSHNKPRRLVATWDVESIRQSKWWIKKF